MLLNPAIRSLLLYFSFLKVLFQISQVAFYGFWSNEDFLSLLLSFFPSKSISIVNYKMFLLFNLKFFWIVFAVCCLCWFSHIIALFCILVFSMVCYSLPLATYLCFSFSLFCLFLPMLTPRAWPKQTTFTAFYVPFRACELSLQVYYKIILWLWVVGEKSVCSNLFKEEEISVEIPEMRWPPWRYGLFPSSSMAGGILLHAPL